MIDTISLVYMLTFFILAIVLLISLSVLKHEKLIEKIDESFVISKSEKK